MKHAKKNLRRQEHQDKGEPESSDDDDEAKRKEEAATIAAEQKEMEEAALLAAHGGEEVSEEGQTILVPAAQSPLLQQQTVLIPQPAVAATPSHYGLVTMAQMMQAAHPALHAAHAGHQLTAVSSAQPQLVQLPNGQLAYAAPAAQSMPVQAGAPMMAMPQAVAAGHVAQHVMVASSGGHPHLQLAHHGMPGTQYVTHMMAAQAQAQAQAQAVAQAQAAQAVQVAQVQAAHAQAQAQAQAAQAAHLQPQLHGVMPGVHYAQQLMPAAGLQPHGQIILVPRIARPHI